MRSLLLERTNGLLVSLWMSLNMYFMEYASNYYYFFLICLRKLDFKQFGKVALHWNVKLKGT